MIFSFRHACALFLLAVGFGTPLPAQEKNDAGYSGSGWGPGPSVASNAELSALPAAAGFVLRVGFAVAGDAPPLGYVASGSPCSLAGGAGDGGAQVPTGDGKCWIAQFPGGQADIREWGASCNLAVDNSGPVQKALDWAANATLLVPCLIGVQSGLVLGNGTATRGSTTNQNFAILGAAGPGIYDQFVAGDVAGPGFRYTGAGLLAGAVLTINGPIVGSLRNLVIDGRDKARTGILATHLTGARNENLTVAHVISTGIRLDAYPDITAVYTGANDNDWTNTHIYMGRSAGSDGGAGVSGLDIGFASAGTRSNPLDVARNHFHTGQIIVPPNRAATAITLRGTDLDTFDGIFTYSTGAGTGAYGVAVRPPVNAPFLPNSVTFTNSPLVGGVSIGEGWTCATGGAGEGLVFLGLPTGDMTTQGRAVPSGPCIHGITNNGTMFDQYQPLSRKSGNQLFYSPAVLFRNLTSLVTRDSAARATLASYTLPANAMQSTAPDNGAFAWDRALKVACSGVFINDTGSPQTLGLRVSLGSTTVADTGNVTVPPSAFHAAWRIEATIFAAGSPRRQRSEAEAAFGAAGSVGGMATSPRILTGEYSDLTVDLATDQELLVSTVLGMASPNFGIERHACMITLL